MRVRPWILSSFSILSSSCSRGVTIETYAQSLLDQIKERDGVVKARAYLDPEFVLEQARALDQVPHNERGPLHGIAIGIKDIMNTKDMPTQFGSPIYTGHQSRFDSSAVAILRHAGALMFGKATTTEFTVTNSGPNTTNTHDPNRTPGGSSCGSAAAVADFQVTLSVGAQTGGSVIRPASYTGVFAYKPTYNVVLLEGQETFAPTFDTFGFFARSIDDLQLLADVFAIKDDHPPKDIQSGDVSVALIHTPMWAQAGPSTVAAMEKAATILQNWGAHVEEVAFPAELSDADALRRIQKVITSFEAQKSFLREHRVDKERLTPEICGMVENAANYTNKEVAEASDTYARMRHVMNDLAKEYSVILTPSAVDEAPLGLGDMGSATFNTPWTGLPMPVINIPAFIGAHGMPVGVSLVAPQFHGQHLLRISKVLGGVLIAEGGWRI
ncbi:amidase [Aspergillus lucknowensis]|uniref:Amidase signature domain-containing protein n=1 Tax=Aspergillus lucknowensis TaxID=176173 RepID=A0ABR4LSZ5_9EURO